MIWIWIIAVTVCVIIPLLMLWSVKGQRRQEIACLQSTLYAHRGLHGGGIPENSRAAFRAAVENGFGAELDVHLLADGGLAVIHDRSLKRTAGVDVDVTSLTTASLPHYALEQTEETIPTLQEVLSLFDGKAPLIIELKADKGNCAALCEAVSRCLEGYTGDFCLESFDPRCVWWLRRHRPEWIRGQLSQNYFKSKDVPPVLRPILTSLFTNAFTRPDFVAYRYEHRHTAAYAVCRHVWKIPVAAWTLRSEEELSQALKDGAMPIFEGFVPTAK